MFIARNKLNQPICAHCGCVCEGKALTLDHFVPKSSRMNINREGNYVGLCVNCNREKADRIVLPDWYKYLNDKQKNTLLRYFRYASLYIRDNCEDKEVLEYLDRGK